MFQVRHVSGAFAAMLLFVAHAEAATYYVSTAGNDSNPGTQQQPFRTIKKGVGALQPGDTVYIRSGTYTERLFEIDFGSGGTSWANPVTVAAYPGEAVILMPTQGMGGARFAYASPSYIHIDGLVLDGALAGGGEGASVFYCGPTSHDLHLSNVEIRNGDGNGVLCEGANHEFRDLKVHHNGLYAGYTNSNGMYMTTDNTVIIGGEFYDNECYGVRFFDSDTSRSADNNTVTNARIYNNGFGIGLNGASQCGSGGGGIVLGDVNNVASNNLVYGNYWGFNSSSNASGLKLYNNTFYGNANGIWITNSSNAEVKNNIIYQNGTGITNEGMGTVLSNNFTGDPMFTDPSAFDLSLRPGSPAVDRGMTLSTVTTDIRGVARPQGGAYDIGAYEQGGSTTSAPAAPTNVRIIR